MEQSLNQQFESKLESILGGVFHPYYNSYTGSVDLYSVRKDKYETYHATNGASVYHTFYFELSEDQTVKVVVRVSDHSECYAPASDVDFQYTVSPYEHDVDFAIAKIEAFKMQELEYWNSLD